MVATRESRPTLVAGWTGVSLDRLPSCRADRLVALVECAAVSLAAIGFGRAWIALPKAQRRSDLAVAVRKPGTRHSGPALGAVRNGCAERSTQVVHARQPKAALRAVHARLVDLPRPWREALRPCRRRVVGERAMIACGAAALRKRRARPAVRDWACGIRICGVGVGRGVVRHCIGRSVNDRVVAGIRERLCCVCAGLGFDHDHALNGLCLGRAASDSDSDSNQGNQSEATHTVRSVRPRPPALQSRAITPRG